MKIYNVQYIKGHLVDIESKKKIFLKRGGSFYIHGDNDQFEEKDELQYLDKPLPSNEKLASLRKEYRDFYFEKIYNAETEFVYRIGLSKKSSEDKVQEFLFNAIIKEDLYLKSKNGVDWSLCPCVCQTTECLEGDVQLIESVSGSSLSNLFGNVVTYYFPLQRSTACNAFKTFFLNNQNKNLTLNDIKYGHAHSIDEFRRSIKEKYSNTSLFNSIS